MHKLVPFGSKLVPIGSYGFYRFKDVQVGSRWFSTLTSSHQTFTHLGSFFEVCCIKVAEAQRFGFNEALGARLVVAISRRPSLRQLINSHLCNMQSNVLNDLAKAKRRRTEKKTSSCN